MRYLRIVDTIGRINHLDVSPSRAEGSALAVGLLENVSKQRFRSCTLGNMLLICRRLQEEPTPSVPSGSDAFSFDAAGDDNDANNTNSSGAFIPGGGGGVAADDGSPDRENHIYIIVASDEGCTEATLNRIANLIAEVCGYLTVGNPMSDRLIMMLLRYIDGQMAARDLNFINQAVERIDESKIPPMWDPHLSIKDYKGNILMHALNSAPGSRRPGYAVSMYGQKILLETSPQYTADAMEHNEDDVEFSDSVRYIVSLLTAAFFSSPIMDYTSDVIPSDHELRQAEETLYRFGIHRYNVSRTATANLMKRTLKHLRLQVPGKKHAETQSADSYESAYELLKTWDERMNQPVRHTYHHADKLRPERSEREWTPSDRHTFDFLFFDDDGDQHRGCLQFCWTPVNSSPDGEFAELYPRGVGTGILYFGNDDWDPRSDEAEPVIPITVLQDQLSYLYSLNCMELSFVAINWLSHPPLNGFSIPGLVNFFCVDRRRNRGLVCSKEEMIGGCRTQEGKKSIHQLHHTMHHCISEAHQLLTQGYSEGLWGHLGMQFFFQITIQKEKKDSGGAGDIKEQKEARTITDPELVKTFIAAPFNAASTDRLDTNEFIFEMYAIFVGSMNPREVHAQVQQLTRSLFDQRLL